MRLHNYKKMFCWTQSQLLIEKWRNVVKLLKHLSTPSYWYNLKMQMINEYLRDIFVNEEMKINQEIQSNRRLKNCYNSIITDL